MNSVSSLFIIFIIVGIGFFCGKSKVLNTVQSEGLELYLFKIAIPCYLFNAILNHQFSDLINVPYIYAYLVCFLIVALMTVAYFWNRCSLSNICINVLASGYVNAAIYTLPVITFLLGDPKAAILGNLIQVIIIQSIFITLLSFFKHQEKSIIKKLSITFKSPLIMIPIIGLAVNYFQLPMPSIITVITQNLGTGAASLSLFTFGLTLSNLNRQGLNKDLFFIILTKNILHPLIAVLIGFYIFNLEQYWLYSLIIATSAPTAFIVYLIAKQFSTHENLVKLVITISSIISLISLLVISQIRRILL